VATVETPEIFVRCLDTWLRNDPLEIIIVTVKPNLNRLRNLISQASLTAEKSAKVSIHALPASQVGKRSQMAIGISKARGAIIATPDDGIIWPDRYLEYMLPPFEDASVGAVGSNMTVYIPPSRRNAATITPWEVAMCRLMFGRRNYEAMWAAARWCWILTGCTGMWRADILNTKEYLDAFLNDRWMGRYRLDVGDDTFTTRWVIAQGYFVAFQAMPETVIERAAKTTSWFLKGQLVRWQRSTIQSFIRTLCYEPRLWK
jgi:cellulose synthase/poly-beta-1,6-N-acetylglucosamine synthase-like glycosyltransferase